MPYRTRRGIIRTAALLIAAAAAALGSPTRVGADPVAAGAPPSGTRALYAFHRDDAAGETVIAIDAARTGATPLSRDVFGNFVEHLGDVVYNTLWADALENPSFERGDPQQTEPPYWDQTGAAEWMEKGAGFDSPACEQVSAPDGVVSQQVFLPVARESRYTATLELRAPGEPGRIALQLRAGADAAGPVIVSSPVAAANADWRRVTLHWSVPSGSLAVGQPARVVAEHAGGGPVMIDELRCFPDDAVDGMDPETLRLASAWSYPVLRLSGNFSSGYDWRDGVGPRDARPTLPNPAWPGIESNQFGTDEFLDLCRLTHATPQIGANAGNGTPAEAAAWVRYVNPPGQPARAPIWEIGNELYGGWQIGHTDPKGNADRFIAFRDAMLRADPRIRLIATGRGESFLPENRAELDDWNSALLSRAASVGGRLPDWLSIHPLLPLPGGADPATPYDRMWPSVMAHPEYIDQTLLPELEATLHKYEGPSAPTRIAPTEWGLILGGDAWQKFPNHNVEAGCVYNALALDTFLRNGDEVTLANVTALLHGGDIAKERGVDFVMPEYYTGQLYALAAPRVPVRTVTTGPAYDVAQLGWMPAVSGVPDVDTFSALTADHRGLVVCAVNRDLQTARPLRVTITGFHPAPGAPSGAMLTSDDPQATNTWDHPNTVHPVALPAMTGDAASGYRTTLPPHSVVVMTFTRAAGG